MSQLDLFAEPEVGIDIPWAALLEGRLDAKDLNDEQLVAAIEHLETAYRAGAPLVSDTRFDHEFLAELRRR